MPGPKRDYTTTVVPVQITGTAGAYSANDVMGGRLTIPVASRGAGGILASLRVRDVDNVRPALVIYLFDAAPTAIADNDAFALVDADADKLIGTIAVAASDWINFTAFGWVHVMAKDATTGDSISFHTPTGILYAYAKCTGTPTMLTTTALKLAWTIWSD